jgi:hypothetical protein
VGLSSHIAPPTISSDERAAETPADLIALVPSNCLSWGPEIVERNDHAIGRTDDDHNLGSLYIARALALQGRGNASAPAAAAHNAVPHLVAAGVMQTAAFASAMAAVFLDQSGEPIAAINHAVDAPVVLGHLDIEPTETQLIQDGARAALALSGFFLRLSAFDRAVSTAERAFQSGRVIEGVPLDPHAHTAGYVAVEAAHVIEDEATRLKYVERSPWTARPSRASKRAPTTIAWFERYAVAPKHGPKQEITKASTRMQPTTSIASKTPTTPKATTSETTHCPGSARCSARPARMQASRASAARSSSSSSKMTTPQPGHVHLRSDSALTRCDPPPLGSLWKSD